MEPVQKGASPVAERRNGEEEAILGKEEQAVDGQRDKINAPAPAQGASKFQASLSLCGSWATIAKIACVILLISVGIPAGLAHFEILDVDMAVKLGVGLAGTLTALAGGFRYMTSNKANETNEQETTVLAEQVAEENNVVAAKLPEDPRADANSPSEAPAPRFCSIL